MDISKIRKLIKLVNASDIAEIEVVEGTHSVRISRMPPSTASPQPAPMTPPVASDHAAAPDVTQPTPQKEVVESDAIEEAHLVKSPMVGTFYRAPAPDAEPFVREGSQVRKGDTLCIIEAMKLMNEIEAEYDGVVRRILLDNATPVEYGQAMFEITPTA